MTTTREETHDNDPVGPYVGRLKDILLGVKSNGLDNRITTFALAASALSTREHAS